MKDKSLGILLTGLFGITGLVAIALGWLLPWLESERVPAMLAGGAGLMIAGIQAFILRRVSVREKVLIEVKDEERS